MRSRLVAIAALVLAAVARPAAGESAVQLAGVWTGEIGGKPVVACFDDVRGGLYYYLAHANAPSLELQADADADAVWLENDAGRPTGKWSDVAVEGDRLAGRWTSADGKRTAAIALSRTAPVDAGADCMYGPPDAFFAPRRAALKIDTGPVTSAHGIAVRKVSLAGEPVSVLQLARPDAAGERINAHLREWFEDALEMHYDCEEHDGNASKLLYADTRWLVVSQWTYAYCGGAHPDGHRSIATFDRRTGQLVPALEWLGAEGEVAEGLVEPIARQLVRAGGNWAIDSDAGCHDGWARAHYAEVWPSAGGISFQPSFSHALRPCEESVELPIRQVAPFLTDAGRAALAPIDP